MLEGIASGTMLEGAASATVIIALIGAFGYWIRGTPDRLLRRNEADASLRGDLLSRIAKLEEIQIIDRERHAKERKEDREECDRTTEELRQRIREQDKLIDGLQRQLIMFQVATGRALPLGDHSPEMQQMVASLSKLYGKENRRGNKSQTLKAAEETEQAAEVTHHAAEVTLEQVKQDEVVKDSPSGKKEEKRI